MQTKTMDSLCLLVLGSWSGFWIPLSFQAWGELIEPEDPRQPQPRLRSAHSLSHMQEWSILPQRTANSARAPAQPNSMPLTGIPRAPNPDFPDQDQSRTEPPPTRNLAPQPADHHQPPVNRNKPAERHHVTCSHRDRKNSSPASGNWPATDKKPARSHAIHHSDTLPSRELTGAPGSGCRYVFWRAGRRASPQAAAVALAERQTPLTTSNHRRSWRRFILSRAAAAPSVPRGAESGA